MQVCRAVTLSRTGKYRVLYRMGISDDLRHHLNGVSGARWRQEIERECLRRLRQIEGVAPDAVVTIEWYEWPGEVTSGAGVDKRRADQID